LCEPVNLDLGVSAQKRGGNLVRIDAHRQVDRVVNHVLSQVDAQIEHVITASPTAGNAIGGRGRTVNADQMLADSFQELVAERKRTVAGDSVSGKSDSAVPEAHVLLSKGLCVARKKCQFLPAEWTSQILLVLRASG